jgi:retron-type reverse transcriptase
MSDKVGLDIFEKIFSIENIKNTYDSDITSFYLRGIDRLNKFHFDKDKDNQFKIIHDKCTDGTYKYSPYLQKLVIRGKDRLPREISIATIRDRIVLSLLKELIYHYFPACINKKLPNEYIRETLKNCKKPEYKDYYIFKTDIESFYDNIVHKELIRIISEKISTKREITLIRRAIETAAVPIVHKKEDLKNNKRTKGVPQGLAISNILANIYLHKSDTIFDNNSLFYLRYVDDMLFIVKKEDEEVISSIVEKELETLGLSIHKNDDKTCFVPIDGAFDYLGYSIKMPVVSIKKRNIEKYLSSLSSLFSVYNNYGAKIYNTDDEDLALRLFIDDVNEKITGSLSENRRYGWIFYFLEMNDLKLLYTIDLIIADKFCGRLKNKKASKIITSSIKKLTRAYYHARYCQKCGYINNYDLYDSLSKKLQFLLERGFIKKGEENTLSPQEIENRFKVAVKKRLSGLEADIGETS